MRGREFPAWFQGNKLLYFRAFDVFSLILVRIFILPQAVSYGSFYTHVVEYELSLSCPLYGSGRPLLYILVELEFPKGQRMHWMSICCTGNTMKAARTVGAWNIYLRILWTTPTTPFSLTFCNHNHRWIMKNWPYLMCILYLIFHWQ